METLLRRRLKALQYRHGVLGGFLAGTALALDRPDGPYYAEVSKLSSPVGSALTA
ncbi:hypothetical protein ACFZDK_54615 [Streptomyces sp. NPDC007901]|uniref:hypothetical protein n=1 Tax=Streptomyces sp. NPDC007901 TaxID=3364785 RepID=UPI0036EAEFC2